MKKNKNLIYLLLLAGAAVAFIAFKKKPKLKGKVIVDDLQKITKEEFEVRDTTNAVESTPDILIREVKEAVESTPNPLDTILTKAKGIFKKKAKTVKPTKAIFKPTLKPKIKMPTLVIPKIKPVKKVKPIKKAKKRVKGFDDISVLY